jgi:hypothetical protein
MKPEVEAEIESRRQWFWVWTLGLTVGLFLAIAIHFLQSQGFTDALFIAILLLVASGLWLFIVTLRLQRALLTWTVFILAITAVCLTVIIGFINNVLLS